MKRHPIRTLCRITITYWQRMPNSISVGFLSAPIGYPANRAFPEQSQCFCSDLWWGFNWVPKHIPSSSAPIQAQEPRHVGGKDGGEAADRGHELSGGRLL